MLQSFLITVQMGRGRWEDDSAGRPPRRPMHSCPEQAFPPTNPSAGPKARVPHPTSLDKLSAWMSGGEKGLGFPCTHCDLLGLSQPCTLWSSTWVPLMGISVPTRLPVQENLWSSATQPTLILPWLHHARSMYSRSKAWVNCSVSWGLHRASLANKTRASKSRTTRKAESGLCLQDNGASSTKDKPKHIFKAMAICPFLVSFYKTP